MFKILIILLVFPLTLFAEDAYYFDGGSYKVNIQPEKPVKVAGVTWFGPETTLFWETDASTYHRGLFALTKTAEYGADNVKLLPTHMDSSATYSPKKWISKTEAITEFTGNIKMGAIVKNPKNVNKPDLYKINSAEIVALVTNPKTNQMKEFKAPVDVSQLKFGAWKADEAAEMKASAKYVDKKDLGLPSKTMDAIGDTIAKFAKSEKTDSSDLEVKILVRFKMEDNSKLKYTEDYLLSANNKENLDMLNLRGVLNSFGIFNASRAIHDAIGSKKAVEVNESTGVKPSTLTEIDTFVGSEERASKGKTK